MTSSGVIYSPGGHTPVFTGWKLPVVTNNNTGKLSVLYFKMFAATDNMYNKYNIRKRKLNRKHPPPKRHGQTLHPVRMHASTLFISLKKTKQKHVQSLPENKQSQSN